LYPTNEAETSAFVISLTTLDLPNACFSKCCPCQPLQAPKLTAANAATLNTNVPNTIFFIYIS
jgi:hypothetical protein